MPGGSYFRPRKGTGMAKGNDNDRYVVPNEDRGGWDVKKEDAQRASAHKTTKKDAEARAKEIVENTGRGHGETRIQNRDGKFSDSDSGSKMSLPPRTPSTRSPRPASPQNLQSALQGPG